MVFADDPPQILIAEGLPESAAALAAFAEGEGCRVQIASSAGALVDAVKAVRFDLALVDIDLTRNDGALLRRLREIDPDLPVLVAMPHGSAELGLEAVRDGARDFIQRPWDPLRLKMALKTQMELGRALRQARRLALENEALRAGGSRTSSN